MKIKSIFTLWLVGMLVVSFVGFLLSTDVMTQGVQGAEPILEEPYVYEDYDEDYGGWTVIFEVFYQDLDGDEGVIFMRRIQMVILHTLVATTIRFRLGIF
jgi:hypothetical protein